MSKADKMFEELDYEEPEATKTECLKYYKDDYNVIMFSLKYKGMWKTGEYDSMCEPITIPELKAMLEKAKELGWEE